MFSEILETALENEIEARVLLVAQEVQEFIQSNHLVVSTESYENICSYVYEEWLAHMDIISEEIIANYINKYMEGRF